MTVAPATCSGSPVDVAVVVGGRWHDLSFARSEILARLVQHDAVRVSLHEDFSATQVIAGADAVIAYTCDIRPTPRESEVLVDVVARGGRLLGLHATNSAIDPPQPGGERVFSTPDAMPEFTALLGSRFLAHPPIAEAMISRVMEDSPESDVLIRGIADFTTVDEVYVAEVSDDVDILLTTQIAGPCRGFGEPGPQVPTRFPVLYRRRVGAGEVVYFTLGHCRGRFDVADLGIADTGVVDRRAWSAPEFREILDRCIAWAVHDDVPDHSGGALT